MHKTRVRCFRPMLIKDASLYCFYQNAFAMFFFAIFNAQIQSKIDSEFARMMYEIKDEDFLAKCFKLYSAHHDCLGDV